MIRLLSRLEYPIRKLSPCVHLPKPLTAEWRDWLRLNRDRGCDRAELFRQAAEQGFDPTAISLELGTSVAAEAGALFSWAAPPLLDPDHHPRAWRLDTPLAQILELPALLSQQDCSALIQAIDQTLVPSTVTTGPDDYRTSRTCHLADAAPALSADLDRRFSALLGVDPAFSEPLQGQRYDPGQYFKAHTDWFAPGTAEFDEHTRLGGQRTWTLMVYLNTVELGGETWFPKVGRAFSPLAGHGLAWNNLHIDGSPNHATLHEALPVQQGRKYVITKWFRAQTGRWSPPMPPV